MVGRWECREPEGSDDVHVVPIDDVIDHVPNDCWCGTRTEVVERDDGSCGWVVTHHSLDGREMSEPDYAGTIPPKG